MQLVKTPITYGAITTAAETPFLRRLESIYRDFRTLIQQYHPDCVAMERLYFTSNQKTVIDVAQARGVLMLTAQLEQIPVSEYTPLQVKQAVVGYGRAEKKQVMELTRRILKLQKIPKPDDAADASSSELKQWYFFKIMNLMTLLTTKPFRNVVNPSVSAMQIKPCCKI